MTKNSWGVVPKKDIENSEWEETQMIMSEKISIFHIFLKVLIFKMDSFLVVW